MAHSTRPVNEVTKNVVPEAMFTAGAWGYESAVREGRLHHREVCRAADGTTLYDQSVAVDYAIGSGQRGISFISDQGGAMYQSPLTWYAHGERWDLSPGYHPGQHQRFERRIGQGCLNCHVGRTETKSGGGELFASPPFVETGLGCERCHGPGAEHIAKHREQRPTPETIVNPRRLSPAARESVCYQCHLHGRERILQPGRWENDFRPGDLVSDIWLVLVDERPPRQGPARAVSQSEQIVASRCAQASQGAFGCISCHDPHGIPAPEERVDFYRQKCLDCHSEGTKGCALPDSERRAQSPLDSCIDCHMPRGLSADVPHTAQTDHRLLRDPSRTAAQMPSHEGRRPVPFQPAQFPVSQTEIERGWGLTLQRMAGQRWQPALAQNSSGMLTPYSGNGSTDLATLNAQSLNALVMGNTEAARDYAERARQLDPHCEPTLEVLSIIEEQLKHDDAALQLAESFLALNPWSATQHQRRARLLQRLGRPREALAAADAALRINPQLLAVRDQLIRLLYDLGETERAAKETALRDQLRMITAEPQPAP